MILRSVLVVTMVAVACFAFMDPACAATVQTIGSGSAIISIDRSVTFDDLDFAGRETPLSDYRQAGFTSAPMATATTGMTRGVRS